MSEELKPCPFCGGKAYFEDPGETDDYGVSCEKCGAFVIFGNDGCTQSKKEAAAGWNKRAQETNVFMNGKHCTTITNSDHLTINL